MKFIGALVLIAAAAGMVQLSTFDSHAESPLTQVSDQKIKPDLGMITSDESVAIFVDKNTIIETKQDGYTFRTASIIYHFRLPQKVKGKDIEFMLLEVAYHCESKLFVTTRAMMFDKNQEPVFQVTEPSDPQEAKEGTNSHAEMSFVCNHKLKKTSPKGKELEVKPKQKYTDV